jgi:hypothetical protein
MLIRFIWNQCSNSHGPSRLASPLVFGGVPGTYYLQRNVANHLQHLKQIRCSPLVEVDANIVYRESDFQTNEC